MVIACLANSFLYATVLFTGWPAKPVKALTDLMVGAVFIVLAAASGACDPGIALGARWTSAACSVI